MKCKLDNLFGNKTITGKQLQYTCDSVEDILNHLSPRALQELLGGYENDLDKLIYSLISETSKIINFHHPLISSDKIFDLQKVESCMHERLKIISYNYFKVSCLPEFSQNWRNLEWGNLVQIYKFLGILASRSSGKSYEFSFAKPLWHLYRYERPKFGGKKNYDNILSKEGVIVSNALKLGNKLIGKMVDEIQVNDVLRDRIVGNKSTNAVLAGTKITTQYGASVELRSFNNTIRGLHPGWITVDDFLDKSAIYSAEQRTKFSEVFMAEIMPALEPGGQIIAVGTPFHQDDLYTKLRKDKRFKMFEYPAVLPNGSLLAPDRYDFAKLDAERKTLGSMVFAREYLITPISNSSTIFPWEILEKSHIGMQTTSLVDNISSYPYKMKRVETACDLAISGNIGSDYCAFITGGLDMDDNFHIINIWHKRGATHDEQVQQIMNINDRFKPTRITIENNAFQRVIAQLARKRGLMNIHEHTTNVNKKSLYEGLPALAATFERGQMRLPDKEDEETKRLIGLLKTELNSMAFDDDKGSLEGSGSHDDLAMATYILFYSLFFGKKQISFDAI